MVGLKLWLRRKLAWLKYVSALNWLRPVAALHRFEFELANESLRRWRAR